MKVELKNYKNRHSLMNRLARAAWAVVWAVFFRPTPRWCLNGWRRFLLRMFGAKIGKAVCIDGSAKIWQPWKLEIGDCSWIGGGVSLYSVDRIVIGSNAVISEGAYICTASHDVSSDIFELKTDPVEIGSMAWVSSRAIVLPRVTIGEGAVVAAGAVVARDIDPWMVAGGNPAKVIKKRIKEQ